MYTAQTAFNLLNEFAAAREFIAIITAAGIIFHI
jgi:hypothetical protein